jgi:UDP-N-acetylmuramoyl-tripeptide--D-alanyl-D-alanine ligase
MRALIQNILKRLAQLLVLRYRPAIVGVTGSVGKTSTKLAIAAVLSAERDVRASKGNFNSDIGVALAIIGDWRKEDLRLLSRDMPSGAEKLRKTFFILKVIGVGLLKLLPWKQEYPEVLVIEYGIDRPGDMNKLLEIARPNISVLTAIGDTPAHVEFFKGPDDVAREKARLIEALPSTGYAILNGDDSRVMDMRARTRAQLMTFGFVKTASVQVTSFENRSDNGVPVGAVFKLEQAGSFVPVRLAGAFGASNAYSSAAAACVGLIFGMNLVSISEALESYYRPAPHRMELLPGVKNSWIIDDSYNAGPLSMRSALETLKELPAGRKIAILGDMLEIGEYALDEHEKIGRLVAKIADILVVVGPHGKFIAEGTEKAGFDRKNILEFENEKDARAPIQELIRQGDLVLVKASHAIRLDRVVNEIKSFINTEATAGSV